MFERCTIRLEIYKWSVHTRSNEGWINGVLFQTSFCFLGKDVSSEDIILCIICSSIMFDIIENYAHLEYFKAVLFLIESIYMEYYFKD